MHRTFSGRSRSSLVFKKILKAYKEAAVHEKLENAKKLRVAGVSVEIISKCTGLSLEEVEAL